MSDRNEDPQLPGGSLLRDHADAFEAHEAGGSDVPIEDLLEDYDIPPEDLGAFEALRSMWAGAPLSPDPHATLDHLVTVLVTLPEDLTVHDAIGWVCATWSTVPESPAETVTDVIDKYSAAPGAWVLHAAGIPPEDVEHVTPEAVEILAILAVARGAHLPPRR